MRNESQRPYSNQTFLEPHIYPDAFSGTLWALDGIKDGLVLLNGPTGCKFYHASVSNSQYCRGTSYNPAQIDEEFYFRQNRIPCTYLDGNDFVYGSEEKLRKALQTTVTDQHGFVAVVNSPGAALIGDNLEGVLEDELHDTPWLAMENTGFSEPFYTGFQKAALALLHCLQIPKQPTRARTVNLIGFSIYQKHHEGNIRELTRLLSLAGIQVISTPMAACACLDLIKSPSAALNVLIAPESGHEIAQWYSDHHQIPCLELPIPIGFDATEHWIKQICEQIGGNPESALEAINYARAVSFQHLHSFNALSGFPKGTFYGIKAEYSLARGLYHFLTPYLGMLPSVIAFYEEPDPILLRTFREELAEKALEGCLTEVESAPFHLLFSDGNTIAHHKARGTIFAGVEVCLPSLGYTDVIPKATMGCQGALYLIEHVINGLKFFCK